MDQAIVCHQTVSFFKSMQTTIPMMRLPGIHGASRDDIAGAVKSAGQPAFRVEQILDWLYDKRVQDFDAMHNVPANLRAALASSYSCSSPECVRVLGSHDTTRKFLFRLADGQLVESVLIPASPALYGGRDDRQTLCVSSQVGCAYGCKFCASGLDGFTRNLDASEIIGQLLAIERETGERVDNVVFMGMGEPLANYDNVLRAIRIMNADWALGIGARRITVSTSGLAPAIHKLSLEPLQIRLAVSLHGATDAVRERIMPVNRRYPLSELFAACAEWNQHRRQKITFEYILIEGVNDSTDDARALANKARLLHAKVNLIPYNTVDGLDWRRPAECIQEAFLGILLDRGIQATLRREKGHDIEAACGQLRRQQLVQ